MPFGGFSWAFRACSLRVSGYRSERDAVKSYFLKGARFPSTWCTRIVGYRFVRRMMIVHLGAFGVSSSNTADKSMQIKIKQFLEKVRFFFLLSWFCGIPTPPPNATDWNFLIFWVGGGRREVGGKNKTDTSSKSEYNTWQKPTTLIC